MTSENTVRRRIALFGFFYFVCYLMRNNVAVIISEIITTTGLSRSDVSLAQTAMLVCYGAGQILSGVLGDLIPPKRLIAAGLAVSALCNVLFPLCTAPLAMILLWGVNGMAQAFFWPPLVRAMKGALPDEKYSDACLAVSYGGHIGTVVLYLVAPLAIRFGTWRASFWFGAASGVLMLVAWCAFCPDVPLVKREKGEKPAARERMPLGFLVPILVSIALMGALRDGGTTWFPSYLASMFGLDNGSSILRSVLLPLCGIASISVTAWLYRRVKNELLLIGVCFGVAALSALLLLPAAKGPAILSALLGALLIGSMYGACLILTCFVPPRLSSSARLSFCCGLINSFAYVGSSLSAYGFAAFSASFGWGETAALWFALAALGFAANLPLVRRWTAHCKK